MTQPLDASRSTERSVSGEHTEEEDLTPTVHSQPNSDYFGDLFSWEPDSNNLIVGFLNVNGLKETAWKQKNDALFELLSRGYFDILGLVEPNLYWPSLNPRDSWDERLVKWKKNESFHSILACNTNDTAPAVHQRGGCIQLSTTRATSRVVSSGKDPSGLGRWVWTQYLGRNNIKIWVITAYRVCSTNSGGPSTIFAQQKQYFNSIHDDRHPRQALLEDLCTHIVLWRDQGEQIVLLIDLNQNIYEAQIKDTFLSIGLTEAITTHH